MSAASKPFKVALVQNCAARDMEPSLVEVERLVRDAARDGADLILLTEMVEMLEPNARLVLQKALPEERDPGLARLRDLAREAGKWIMAGSILIKEAGSDKVVNRAFMLDPAGSIVARYDKIHLFDVDLKGGESYRESDTVRAGNKAVLAPTPWGLLGMTICYDLRFAYLFRSLAQAGASFIALPAAFTYTTGKAHWHVLVRARAIETGCFVFAPCQTGVHAEGRRTYGHSLIVDPWGEVLADAGEEVGFVTATIDPARVQEARSMIPALKHDRAFEAPEVPSAAAAAAE